MKKQIKPIILSAAAALAFGGIAVGTTFALFTSRASTNIQVESGIVNVEQSLAIQSVSELGGVAILPVDGVYTNSIGGKTYLDAENNRILHLEKWAPGDKAVIEIRNVNKSNVAIRSRFSKTHSSTSSVDLYDALKVSYVAYDADDNDITYLVDDWSTFEPAEDTSAGYLLSRVVLTIEFPDGDNGEILFGDDNHDNQYQDSNCSIYFTQEAVQGNAYTPALIDILNEQLAESAQKNKTMFDALSEVELEANAAHYKHYVWDSLEDQFRYDYSVTPSERYFKVYKEAPVDQKFSIYAEGWTTPSTLELNGVGFDAGNSTLFTAINYVNTSGVAKTNTIRTNSGTLTINAGSDIVHHYGYADSLDIIAVAGTSYHEFGEVGYANIANGRLVVEEGSDIGGIFLIANNQGVFDNIKLGVVGEATLPALSRADVSLESGESKLVVEVQTLETSESEDPNPEYVWISNNGSEVDSVVSSSSSEIVEVLEPTAAAEAVKEESKNPSTPIDENSVARINAVGYDTLKLAFDAAVDGDTVYVIKDVVVDVSNPDDFGLYRAGTTYYYGIFYYLEKAINIDGGNHTIRTTGATLLPDSRVNTGFIYYDYRCDSVSITNLNIVSEGFSYVVTYGGVLHGTMENVNITADNACATISVFNPADTEFGVLNIRNCEFNFIKGSLTRSDYAPASSAIAGQYGCTINVEDCDISAVNGGAVFMWPSGGTVNFNSCNIETSDFVGNAWIGNGSTRTKADSVVNFNNSNIICPSDNKYSAAVNGTNKYGHEAYVYVDGTLVATTASE